MKAWSKRKKIIIGLTIAFWSCVLLCCAFVFGANAYVKACSRDRIISVENASSLKADCILVLGCGVKEEKPTHMLEDRLLTGIELFENGASDRLLMSGDHGRKDYDEVNVMKDFAIEKGIEADKIFMDHAGFSTYDSMYRAVKIFGCRKIIIVTQKYHLYRALYIAKCLGLEAYGVNSDPREYTHALYRETREIIARDKDFLKCIIKPSSKYLGEEIPISGSGALTDDRKK